MQNKKNNIFKWVFSIAILMNIAYSVLIYNTPNEKNFFTSHPVKLTTNQKPYYNSSAVESSEFGKFSHSISVIELPNNKLFASWYSGSREGGHDVKIITSTYDIDQQVWLEKKVLFDRQKVMKDTHKYIRKLGNTSLLYHQDQIWMFFVGVSFGGWSGASIYYTKSNDFGNNWSEIKSLRLSPFLNVSNLVKNGALTTTSDHIILPIYHEFLGVFAELLYLKPDGSIYDKQRLTHGRTFLQPEVIALDKNKAIAVFRQKKEVGHKVFLKHTSNSGKTWSHLIDTGAPNPDAAVAAVKYDNKHILIAYNNLIENRQKIALGVCSIESLRCDELYQLEVSSKGGLSYPEFILDQYGVYHVFYTSQSKRFKHHQFNREWIEEQMKNNVKFDQVKNVF